MSEKLDALAHDYADYAGVGEPKKVYLAGPDVFLDDPLAMAEKKKEVLAQYGMIGNFPMDNQIDFATMTAKEAGMKISELNEQMMSNSDTMVGNATPYHGPSIDSGTAFEVGYMRAQKKPVFLYSNDDRTFAERVIDDQHKGEVFVDDNGFTRGATDNTFVESFDLPDNLMMPGAVESSGGSYTVQAAAKEEYLTNLNAFRSAVRDAATHFYGADAVAKMEARSGIGPKEEAGVSGPRATAPPGKAEPARLMTTSPTTGRRRALALRHLSFEDLGRFGATLRGLGFDVDYVEVPDGLEDVDILTPDLVVILGGSIGVYETETYPILLTELDLVRRRLDAGRATLGICLGCQLIAAALGARVYPGGMKEIGWAPLIPSEAADTSPIAALGIADWQVLHWHGDTYDLPAGATRLAGSARYEEQAFSVGDHVLALQFHCEVEPRNIERWLIGHTLEIATTDGISVAGIRADTARLGERSARASADLLTRWLRQAALIETA